MTRPAPELQRVGVEVIGQAVIVAPRIVTGSAAQVQRSALASACNRAAQARGPREN